MPMMPNYTVPINWATILLVSLRQLTTYLNGLKPGSLELLIVSVLRTEFLQLNPQTVNVVTLLMTLSLIGRTAPEILVYMLTMI